MVVRSQLLLQRSIFGRDPLGNLFLEIDQPRGQVRVTRGQNLDGEEAGISRTTHPYRDADDRDVARHLDGR
jgi:hypothetical protein